MRALEHKIVAEELGLVIAPTADLAISRVPVGKDEFGYSLLGQNISAKQKKRIEKLAIPPAWRDVFIAESEDLHVQAVGIDDKGRKQYIYHERWTDVRNIVKADRLVEFGKALPLIRRQVETDMAKSLTRKRAVLATAVKLIDDHLLRVGSEQYIANGTRGATTLDNRHLKTNGKTVSLKYTGKSGKEIAVTVKDRKLTNRLKKLRARKGKRLFSMQGKGRQASRITAAQINTYLARVSGFNVTAKDFRTFAASAYALGFLVKNIDEKKSRLQVDVSKEVAELLRNTPAVARSSYIHPHVFSALENNELDKSLSSGKCRSGLSREETALMRLLERKSA